MSRTVPLKVRRRDPTRVEIDWEDGHTTSYTAAELRRLCPCALCVHELTGKRLLDPLSVPGALTQADVRMIGNYAISVVFSDGHRTGIYPWTYLREQDPSG
jgi:DUF971 family protein